ncbi:hypothetical protein SteCoe_31926 [Stentor coeruleus]|uniref:Rab-GAP TBC domain-containing protein n=1 Tax=Stentor coeruleus TaxID=5963 RepID=A0A1R2B084_9CILI|nr:hypothetical protein SteCoe_31926 [Stentor coeruleus]
MSNITVWGWGRLSASFASVNPIKLNIPENSIGMFISRKNSLIWTEQHLYSWDEDIITSQEHIFPSKLPNLPKKPLYAISQNTLITLVTDQFHLYKYENFLPSAISTKAKIISLSCGNDFILSLDINGSLYSWGNSAKGQLGLGPDVLPIYASPQQLLIEEKFIQISCGLNHSIALDNKGRVFSWGSGADGRLGHGDFKDQWSPHMIESLCPFNIIMISCGYQHSAMIANTGEILSFGFNGYGQLGLGSLDSRSQPCIIESLSKSYTVKLACGGFHTVCICANGDVYAFGLGARGQLGTGNNTNSSLPEKAQLQVPNMIKETKVYCGLESSFIMTCGDCEVGLPSRPTITESQDLSLLSESSGGGFRPSNLPPKSPDEAAYHKKLVEEQEQFYLEKVREKEKNSRERMRRESFRENEIREMMKCWENDILPCWDQKKASKQVEKLIRRGLPAKVRGEIWLRLIGNPMGLTQDFFEITLAKAQKLHEALAQGEIEALGKEGSLKFIKQDISRTFHQMGYFKEGSPLNQQLQDLLEAFTISRPDIGYVQGMSYIAGMLLLNLESCKAFLMLVNIIGSPLLIPFYRLDQVGISHRCQLFKFVLRHNLPEISDHFENEGLKLGVFLIEWFLTLYSRSLGHEVVSRVWDLFFYQGPLVLYKTGVAILKIIFYEILNEELEGIMRMLGQVGNYCDNGDILVDMIESIRIPEWVVLEIASMASESL